MGLKDNKPQKMKKDSVIGCTHNYNDKYQERSTLLKKLWISLSVVFISVLVMKTDQRSTFISLLVFFIVKVLGVSLIFIV